MKDKICLEEKNFSSQSLSTEEDLNLLDKKPISIETVKESPSTESKLPGLWTLAEVFIKDNKYLKYCTYYHSFYYYSTEELIWKSYEKTDVHNLIIKWLKSAYKTSYKNFQPRRLEDLIIILQSETRFSMLEAKTLANKEGLLIPFKKGVLNSTTKNFMPHKPEFYSTHIINKIYNTVDSIESTPFSNFLSQFVSYNPQRLNLLRAMLNIIFTNNTRYQVALHIYGPGGKGKSTLINNLLYLIGPEAAYSTTLTNLNLRFGLSKISQKIFLVLKDMIQFKGKESKILKEVITGDIIESEKKYKDAISIIPLVIVAITNYSIWELVDPTGGINRRIIYFPSDYVPPIKDINLFYLNSLGRAEGTIKAYLPGFLNWILSCPQEYIDSLQVGGETLSKFINPENVMGSHHLNTWIESSLINEGKCPVGNNKSGLDTLYGNYLNWCNINNVVPPIKINRFSELLLDSLYALNWKDVAKKRTSSGYFIIGVQIRTEENLNSIIVSTFGENTAICLGQSTEELNFKN